MSKRRNVRKKLDESESEDHDDSPTISTKKRSKQIPSTVSFDDIGEETFHIKKSKESRQLKKSIRQAPDLHQFIELEEANPTISSDRSYSEKSLQELRQNQLFKVPATNNREAGKDNLKEFATTSTAATNTVSEEEIECIVVNGDEAETLEETTIATLSQQKILHIYDQHDQNLAHVQLQNKEENAHDLNVNSFMGDNEENEHEWENQVAARGGIKLHHIGASTLLTKANNKPLNRGTTITSIKQSLTKNLSSIKDICSKQSKQIDITQVSLSSLNDEKFSNEKLLQVKVSNLTYLKELRLYISDVVGMLRAKESLIEDMYQAILQCIKQYNQNMQQNDTKSIDEDYRRFYAAGNVVMQDVRSNMNQLSVVLSHFQQFRQRNSSNYQSAYVDLSLPKLIGSFIKLDLLPCLFDFLRENCFEFTFSDRPWYSYLHDYDIESVEISHGAVAGESESGSGSGSSKKSSNSLLSNVMLEVVLPLITHSIDAIMNPFDKRNISMIIHLLQQLLLFHPTQEQIDPLLDEIVLKFEKTIQTNPHSNGTSLRYFQLLVTQMEGLQMLSKFLPSIKILHLVWKYLQNNCVFFLQSLNVEDNPSPPVIASLDQFTTYNSLTSIFQIIKTLTQINRESLENESKNGPAPQSNREVAVLSSINKIVLELIEAPNSENFAKQFSLLQFRRASLITFLHQISSS